MKTSVFHSALFALIGLVLSPLAVAHAAPSPADRVPKCALFDYEQWRRDHPAPAGKRLALDVGEPRTVRMIYFLPNDQPYRAAAVDTMKMRMRQVQDFFAEQMGAHGYGNTVVRFEAEVHRVDGKHPTEHYNTYDTVGRVLDEIDPVFDIASNVYYIAIDNGNQVIRRGEVLVGGVGSRWSKAGGWGLVPISADFGTVAHELGHAFGLSHDFRDDAYVMSYGFIPDWLSTDQRLSACNAEYLAVHTFFNSNSPIGNGIWPTFEKHTSSPVYVAGATSIPVQVKVRDSDGLHQAILLAETQAPHFAEGFLEVKACRGLKSQTAPVVEFDYDGTVPSLRGSDFNAFKTQELVISAVDASGEEGFSDYFELINTDFRGPITTFRPDGFLVSPFFSPDGRLLALEASYEDDRIKLWDVSSGKSIATLPWRGLVETAAFSPDGRLLALEVLDGPAIKLWDVSSSRELVSIDEPHGIDENFPDDESSVVSSLSFSPDGKLLASGGRWDDRVKLWDVSSGKRVDTIEDDGFGATIISLVFSPNGRLLASVKGSTIELWDMSSRKRIRTIDAHDSMEWHSLSFSPDGKLLASGGTRGDSYETKVQESEVKLWNVSTGELITTLFGSGPVAFSPDGKLASASESKTVWFDLDGLEGGTRQGTTYGGNSVKLWDVSTGEPIASLPPYSLVGRMAFSPDGKLLAEKSRDLRLWDVSEWTGEGTIAAVERIPHSLTKVSGDGQEGPVDEALARPFVVSVLDQHGAAFAGVSVTFTVTSGGGTMSPPTATTDANGRARSTLTLGSEPGTKTTVTATVEGLDPVTFTATASEQTPHSLTKVSGDGQEGPASTQLAAPLVVSVLDQGGSPLAGVDVTFSVAAGEGLLTSAPDANPCTVERSTPSATATTDANGQASVRLTLGSELGTNTVEATVEGLEPETFTATAGEQAMPHSLTKVCGDSQEGTAIVLLDEPLVVFVSDEDGAAMAEVVVSFAVTAGGGTLSDTTVTTDANGRAATWLTLGIEAGINAVEATVEGLEPVTFTATAEESPFASLFDLFQSGKRVALPDRPQLAQNAPNPFNSQTVLSYFLLEPGPVRLEVFALSGQRVAVLHQGPQQAGYHRLHWDGRDATGHPVASGAYLYRLVTDEVVLTRKLTLLR